MRHGQLFWTIWPKRNYLPPRGTVVAVDSRELGRRIIKRIVGLPGEHLHLEGRAVFIDGLLLVEPYVINASVYRGTFHVPSGHYLLLGDNRDFSSDARSWRHPYVAHQEIVGRLLTTGGPSPFSSED